MTGTDAPSSFRLAYVPGVIPDKWVRTWKTRSPKIPLTLDQIPATEAVDLLHDRKADAALLRLPIDRTGLHAIPLYTETTVVVVPQDHLLTAAELVSVDDLADDIVLHPLDDTLDWQQLPGQPAIERPATTADAIELVAAGVGVLIVPQSLARLYHRKDLTYRPIAGVPESQVALAWLENETTDLVEQFIGIVRGRTVNSTRGRPVPTVAPPAKKPAAERKISSTGKPPGGGKRRSSPTKGGRKGKFRRR